MPNWEGRIPLESVKRVLEKRRQPTKYMRDRRTNLYPGIYRVSRDKKMTIITQREPSRDGYEDIIIVAYPWVGEDFEKFKENLTPTVRLFGGPGRQNPGGIGTMHLGKGPGIFTLLYAQPHFETERLHPIKARSGVMLEPHGGLPRNLASKYGGWRYRCLREAVHIAVEEEATLQIGRDWQGKILSKKNNFSTDLHKACTELGLTPAHDEKTKTTAYWGKKGGKPFQFVVFEHEPPPG